MAGKITHSADAEWQKQLNSVFSQGKGSPEKQLMTLRAVLAITGVVHEAQMLQLKLWGTLAFGHTTWTAEIDVEGKTVIYDIAKAKHPKHLAQAVAALDRSVHWMLGDNWGLRVNEGSKRLYEGARKATNVNNERAARAGNREG
jgi:hypothetical protein